MNSWFEIHYNDPLIPDDYFKEQLCVRKETFEVILNHLNPLMREDTAMHDCIPPEKVLAIGLYRLSHGNSYVSIGPTFNVGKSTVIEAVQDVVNALFDASDQFIKFPTTPAETAASIETFCENTCSELVNVAEAIVGTHKNYHTPRKCTRLFQSLSVTRFHYPGSSGWKGQVYRCSVWFSGECSRC